MRVAVIGAGLAGLACAYRLQQHGVEAVVFEKSARAGGRVVTDQQDGFVLDAGAQYLLGPEVFSATFGLIRDLKIDADLLPIEPNTGQLYKGRVYHHRVASASGLLHFKGLSILDKAMLPKMALLLSRYGSSLDFAHPELGLDHDGESVAAFILREFSQNILNYVAGPLISTLFFYASHETSNLLYLLLAKHMHRTRMFTLRNGVGSLAARLAERLSVRTNARVDEIRRDGSGWRIGGEQFSDVVSAVRGDQVLKLKGIEKRLTQEDQTFFKDCKYQQAMTVFVATGRPVDGACYGVSIPVVEGLAAATIAFHDYMAPSRVPAGAGLLAVTGGGDNVTEESLLADLRRIYPVEQLANPLFTEKYEWQSAMPMFPPGRYKEIDAFRRRQKPNGLFFCGDYLMGPFVESAISSGYGAADQLMREES